MKNIFYKRGLVLGIIIIFVISAFGASNAPGISKTTENEKQQTLTVYSSEFLISFEQAQEMIRAQKAILLDIQDSYISSKFNGVIPVTLSDLECGSCTDRMFKDYEYLIVYSEKSALRTQASEILRGRNYIVYELVNTNALDDFSLAYKIYNSNFENEYNELPYEEYTPIQISGTTAHVSAYKHDGQIKRLYGEAFSSGESPEESADNFLQANANLFGIEPDDLGDRYLQPIMYNRDTGEYKFIGINYLQYNQDIRVFRSRIILLVRNEHGYPLVLVSADLRDLGGFTPETEPSKLNPEKGINNVLIVSPDLFHFTQPELVIWAGINDMVVQPTLAYCFIGDNDYKNSGNSPQKYLFLTDAETGDILYIENLIVNVDVYGNVQGKATQGKGADICGDELPEPLQWARVNIDSTVAYTDEDGNFTIPNSGSSPVTVESRLWGQWFRVFNQAGASTVLSLSVTPPGPANFMHNDLNNDEYKRAEVNGYLQANIVRDFTLTYNPSYPGLQQNEFPVNVNINDYCNAYYDYSSINFFRSGGGCPNTAFSTVIHHEYGHHLVSMAGSGQGQYGEGMGDVMGVLITDDSGVAYGFYGDCNTPLRNADNDIQYPCSGEIHYCGQLLSGCVWDTRNELEITNPSSYLDIISNLAVNAMLLHTGETITPSITIDYLTLDDDNGNIYDGTPHYWEIATGFGAHNMDAPDLALLSFEFPNGLPEIISPAGGTTVRVIVNGVTGEPEPNTGILHINNGSGWNEIPMVEIEPNVYDAVFPGGVCQNQLSYYFSAETTNGQIQLWPNGAPNDVFTTVFAYGIEVKISDDFENDLGWTVENDPYLTTGAWERGTPVGGGERGDPPTDYDGSGKCYLTDNEYGDSDIDGGITWLISPTIDLSGTDNAKVDYVLWYTNNFGNDPNNDLFKVYVSNNNGANWNLVEVIGPVTTSGWKEKSFMIGDFVTPNDQVKVRFEASDLNDGSVVEAGIDAFSITVFDCEPLFIADLTCDGDLNWSNIKPDSTVTGDFQVGNAGETGSLLNWKIDSYPTWGTWTFTPASGTGLPDGTWVTVNISVVAPPDKNKEFTGKIKIINLDNSIDYCEIDAFLKTPRARSNTFILRLLDRFPNVFLILRFILGLN